MPPKKLFGPEQMTIDDTDNRHVEKCPAKGCKDGWVRFGSGRATCLECQGDGKVYKWRSPHRVKYTKADE